MILKREIEEHAKANNVLKSTIDKDWVLGHFIDAIFSVPDCRKYLIFKGGTCLRKCYFHDYRFSEDLDFTSSNKDFVLGKALVNKILELIFQRAEIPVHLESLSPLRSNDQITGYKAIIKFWGADHSRNQPPPPPKRWTSSVKIEIILYEKLIFDDLKREVYHPYSDSLSAEPLTVPCYSLHEVLAEKLRSIIQRSYTAPRDFYDIWYLSQNTTDINWKFVVEAFHQKMEYKGLTFKGIEQMLNEENEKRLQGAWQNSLGHQIPKQRLPDYKVVLSSVRKLLEDNLL